MNVVQHPSGEDKRPRPWWLVHYGIAALFVIISLAGLITTIYFYVTLPVLDATTTTSISPITPATVTNPATATTATTTTRTTTGGPTVATTAAPLPVFFDGVIPPSREIPAEVSRAAVNTRFDQKFIMVDGVNVAYKEAGNSSTLPVSILLLHGASQEASGLFDRIGTIVLFAAAGYRVCAIDLPSFGQTRGNTPLPPEQFLSNVADALQMPMPVIVSPSMSGRYSIPLLIRQPPRMVGYAPISPVSTFLLANNACPGTQPKQQASLPRQLRSFLRPPYPNLDCIQTPSLVVWGETDPNGFRAGNALMSLLPVGGPFEIAGAGHAAYNDNPPVWHRLLFYFMRKVVQRVTNSTASQMSPY